MNDMEAYTLLASRVGLAAEMMPWIAEVVLDLAVINPVLPATARRLGPILDLRPGQTVLDLGCGKAGLSLPLAYTYKVRLTGVDLMPDFIREAWSRAEYSGLLEFCQFRQEDAAEFVARARGSWDAVLVVGALPYLWADQEAGLAAIKALIRPGGHLVVGLPYLKPDGQRPEGEPKNDEPRKTKEEITGWLGSVGQVVEVLDDGEEGWRAYVEPQRKAVTRLRKDEAANQPLMAFLDDWMAQIDWEMKNLGYALWVLKVG